MPSSSSDQQSSQGLPGRDDSSVSAQSNNTTLLASNNNNHTLMNSSSIGNNTATTVSTSGTTTNLLQRAHSRTNLLHLQEQRERQNQSQLHHQQQHQSPMQTIDIERFRTLDVHTVLRGKRDPTEGFIAGEKGARNVRPLSTREDYEAMESKMELVTKCCSVGASLAMDDAFDRSQSIFNVKNKRQQKELTGEGTGTNKPMNSTSSPKGVQQSQSSTNYSSSSAMMSMSSAILTSAAAGSAGSGSSASPLMMSENNGPRTKHLRADKWRWTLNRFQHNCYKCGGPAVDYVMVVTTHTNTSSPRVAAILFADSFPCVNNVHRYRTQTRDIFRRQEALLLEYQGKIAQLISQTDMMPSFDVMKVRDDVVAPYWEQLLITRNLRTPCSFNESALMQLQQQHQNRPPPSPTPSQQSSSVATALSPISLLPAAHQPTNNSNNNAGAILTSSATNTVSSSSTVQQLVNNNNNTQQPFPTTPVHQQQQHPSSTAGMISSSLPQNNNNNNHHNHASPVSASSSTTVDAALVFESLDALHLILSYRSVVLLGSNSSKRYIRGWLDFFRAIYDPSRIVLPEPINIPAIPSSASNSASSRHSSAASNIGGDGGNNSTSTYNQYLSSTNSFATNSNSHHHHADPNYAPIPSTPMMTQTGGGNSSTGGIQFISLFGQKKFNWMPLPHVAAQGFCSSSIEHDLLPTLKKLTDEEFERDPMQVPIVCIVDDATGALLITKHQLAEDSHQIMMLVDDRSESSRMMMTLKQILSDIITEQRMRQLIVNAKGSGGPRRMRMNNMNNQSSSNEKNNNSSSNTTTAEKPGFFASLLGGGNKTKDQQKNNNSKQVVSNNNTTTNALTEPHQGQNSSETFLTMATADDFLTGTDILLNQGALMSNNNNGNNNNNNLLMFDGGHHGGSGDGGPVISVGSLDGNNNLDQFSDTASIGAMTVASSRFKQMQLLSRNCCESSLFRSASFWATWCRRFSHLPNKWDLAFVGLGHDRDAPYWMEKKKIAVFESQLRM